MSLTTTWLLCCTVQSPHYLETDTKVPKIGWPTKREMVQMTGCLTGMRTAKTNYQTNMQSHAFLQCFARKHKNKSIQSTGCMMTIHSCYSDSGIWHMSVPKLAETTDSAGVLKLPRLVSAT